MKILKKLWMLISVRRHWRTYLAVLLLDAMYGVGYVKGRVDGRNKYTSIQRYEIKYLEAHGRYNVDLIPVKYEEQQRKDIQQRHRGGVRKAE